MIVSIVFQPAHPKVIQHQAFRRFFGCHLVIPPLGQRLEFLVVVPVTVILEATDPQMNQQYVLY